MTVTQVAELSVWQDRCHVLVEAARAEDFRAYLRDHHVHSASPEPLSREYVTVALSEDVGEGFAQHLIDHWNHDAYAA
jgi:hypothetical protein